MGQTRPLYHLFSSFKTHITVLQQINVKNSQGIPIRQIFACVLVDFE